MGCEMKSSRKLFILIQAVAIFSAGDVFAQRAGQVMGVGTTPCGEYLDAQDQGVGASYQYVNWIYGYLSAYNIYSSYPAVKIPGVDELQKYFEKYCRANPQATVVSGTAQLVGDLGGFKPK